MLEKQWSWTEELTQFALEQGVNKVIWIEQQEELQNIKKEYQTDGYWSGFYCVERKVILINLLALKSQSKWEFYRYGGLLLTTETNDNSLDALSVYEMKSEEEALEKLSLLTLCHEIQHHIQNEHKRLEEEVDTLELEAEAIGSKCLLSFKKCGNLNEIKEILTI